MSITSSNLMEELARNPARAIASRKSLTAEIRRSVNSQFKIGEDGQLVLAACEAADLVMSQIGNNKQEGI